MEFMAGFVMGSATLAGGMLLLARVILTSPVLLKAVEALADSWPRETRDAINSWGRLAILATNGVPDAPDPVEVEAAKVKAEAALKAEALKAKAVLEAEAMRVALDKPSLDAAPLLDSVKKLDSEGRG